jgi:ribosomal protein L35
MANKSYTKRVRVSPKGKLLVRKPGGNHFNAKESRKTQLNRKRSGHTLTMTSKKTGRHLKG